MIVEANHIKILISSLYKISSATLDPIDLDTLTKIGNWIIVAGDFNSKRPLWNNCTVNAAGWTLYGHVQHNDYAVLASSTPTYNQFIR